MNPMHRDRMVFARVCSGKFTRDQNVYHSRLGKEIRLSSTHNVFGRDRETVDEAYPGDILGFVTNTPFQVGDTITSDTEIVFHEIPRFAPECFAYIHNVDSASYKSFRKGFEHLLAENLVQPFNLTGHMGAFPLLGAIGPLQFEVLQYRLRDEYNAESRLETMPWTCMRWLAEPLDDKKLKEILPYGAGSGKDFEGRQVILFTTEWSLQFFESNNPSVGLLESPL